MREILYKAKTCRGDWVQGLLAKKNNMFYISNKAGAPFAYEVRPETICQYTGLTDKNGKKIWENDFVNCQLGECCGKVVWNKSKALFSFVVLCADGAFEEEYLYDYHNYLEVIGNVIDNPELMEESEYER